MMKLLLLTLHVLAITGYILKSSFTTKHNGKSTSLVQNYNQFATPNQATGAPVRLSGTKEIVDIALLPGRLGSVDMFKQAFMVNGIGAVLLGLSKQKSLTKTGLLHSAALGIGLWSFLGYQGWLVCVSYLILGSFATKVKMKEKEKLGIAEKRGGRRGPENVWGSAATAMVCALLSGMVPSLGFPAAIRGVAIDWVGMFKLGFVASLATKLADTWSSELGKAYGKTTYLVTNFKLVPPGTEGAVSLEGTLGGVVGGLLLTLLAQAPFLAVIPASGNLLAICLLSTLLATTIESYIGAVYQNEKVRPWLTNEFVNFIMTVIGAALAMGMYVAHSVLLK